MELSSNDGDLSHTIKEKIKVEMKKPDNIKGLFYPLVKNGKIVYHNNNYGKLKYI